MCVLLSVRLLARVARAQTPSAPRRATPRTPIPIVHPRSAQTRSTPVRTIERRGGTPTRGLNRSSAAALQQRATRAAAWGTGPHRNIACTAATRSPARATATCASACTGGTCTSREVGTRCCVSTYSLALCGRRGAGSCRANRATVVEPCVRVLHDCDRGGGVCVDGGCAARGGLEEGADGGEESASGDGAVASV